MENRKHFRYNCEFSGEIKFGEEKFEEAMIKDVSHEGLRLQVQNVDLIPDPNVGIKVVLPKQKKPLLISGTVKWSDHLNHGMDVGIKLNQASETARKKIFHHGFSMWKSQEKNKMEMLKKTSH